MSRGDMYPTYDVPDAKKGATKVYHRMPNTELESHVPDGQSCWCKPGIQPTWDRPAHKRNEVVIVHNAKTQ